MKQTVLSLFLAALAISAQSAPCTIADQATDPGLFVDFEGDVPENSPAIVCLPMRSADIRGSVVDGIVEVTLTQEFDTYVCPSCFWPILQMAQGSYQLPLDEKASVTAFRAELGDRVIDGIVKDKEEAEQEYNDAVDAGKPAALAEQTRPDIFKISIGNMPPNVVVRVILTYVAPLEVFDADTYRFVLPTKVAPRYHPRDEDEPIPNVQPLLNNAVTIGLGVVSSTDIEMNSFTHALEVQKVTDTVNIVQVVDTDPLQRDVVIDMTARSLPSEPQIFIEESSNGTYAMMMSWVPQFNASDSAEGNKEFIFILDRSGSMNGEKIFQLRSAMRTIMESLPADSLFNIVGFGSTYEFLFEEGSELVSDDISYNSSLSYIDSLTANFGGTEILSPIEAVLASPAFPSYQRIVFLITDGQVTNEDQVVNYVGDNLGSSRVFTLGIGPNAARTLLNGVARNGAGTSDYVNGDSDIAIIDAVNRQLSTALRTSSLSIEAVTFNNITSTQAPHQSPSFFSGRRLLLYFLTDADSDGGEPPSEVTITVVDTNNATDSLLYEISSVDFIQTSSVFESDVIHKIAAREMIRDLEEGRSSLHENQNEPSEAELEEEIVTIGIKYQIISSETSFVAVDNEGWTATAVTKELDEGNGGAAFVAPVGAPVGGTASLVICFSPMNTVITRDRGTISIQSLKIGDEVDVGNGRFSSVYSFGHYDEYQLASYIQLYTKEGNAPLEISSDHLVNVHQNGKIPASEVNVGDQLLLRNGEKASVTKISVVDRVGAYAPFTMSGSVVVSGVVASCYVAFPEVSEAFRVGTRNIVSAHWLAHAFQVPHRVFCSINPIACAREDYTDAGISSWVRAPLLFIKWLISQGDVVLRLLFAPITLAAAIFYLFEIACMSSFLQCIVVVAGFVFASIRMKSKVA